ncbi:unnamed protein product [Effrenium voratum]|uniref:Uncharacterized protein n=1 Tax=Effrenium voratum TaxID=2562239 RepID=A0AA36JAV3_9DINO|nr:unnamed protein product [Effrenium voratum]
MSSGPWALESGALGTMSPGPCPGPGPYPGLGPCSGPGPCTGPWAALETSAGATGSFSGPWMEPTGTRSGALGTMSPGPCPGLGPCSGPGPCTGPWAALETSVGATGSFSGPWMEPTGTRTSAVGAISSMSTGPWTALEPVGAGAYGSYSSSCEAVGQDWAANLSCLKCGKSMLPDSLYCRHCGHKRDTPVGYDLANGLSGLNGAPVPPPLGLDTPNKTFDTQIFPTQPALDPPGSKRLSPHRVVYTGHGLDVQAPLPPSRLGTSALPMTAAGLDGDVGPLAGKDERERWFQHLEARPYAGVGRVLSPSPERVPSPAPDFRTDYIGAAKTKASPQACHREGREAYGFPSAGSFVAEPFREGVPSYPPSQSSYPSAPDRSRLARAQLLEPERYELPRAGTGAEGDGFSPFRDRSPMAERDRAPSGLGYGRGDTYSGGTMSVGPPPSRCGSYSPGYAMPTYALPSASSFVAEPFAPGAPSLRPAVLPLPGSYGGSGLGLGIDPLEGYGAGLGGRGGLGTGCAGNMYSSPPPGPMFSMPPATGSFVADTSLARSQTPSSQPGLNGSEEKCAGARAKSVQASPAEAGEAKASAPRPVTMPRKSKKKASRGTCC